MKIIQFNYITEDIELWCVPCNQVIAKDYSNPNFNDFIVASMNHNLQFHAIEFDVVK